MSEINFNALKESLVDNILMIKLSSKVQMFVRKRVYAGEYLTGSTGGADYSTTPMPVPYGAFVKKFGKTFLRKKSRTKNKTKMFNAGKDKFTFANSQDFKVFRSKSGKTMVIIPGGYKQWRQINSKNTSPVNMTWSARMMRNLGTLRTEKNISEIGFPSSEEGKKSYYQHIGAGKKKVIRNFMDVSQRELDELADLAELLVFQNLKKNL